MHAQSEQVLQFSVHDPVADGSQNPSPQSGVHTPLTQVEHGGHVLQSDGQVSQFSPHSAWHTPLPQSGLQMPFVQVVHNGHAHSAAVHVLQFSQGAHVPSPQADWQSYTVPFRTQFSKQSSQPQSDGQLLQSSQAGLQMLSPQASSQLPNTQLNVQGGHAHSGQVLQFSLQGGPIWQVALPQSGVQMPPMQVLHERHPQSATQVLQSSKQGGPCWQTPLPQSG